MDIDLLSKMVKDMVLDKDEVTLPGVGTFVAEMVPASFSDRGYTINPPYRRLYFRQRADAGDTTLADLYAAGNGIGREQALQILTAFLAEMKEVLKAKKTIVLPGLGRLRATKENNFFFVADEDLDIWPAGYGLEPISLKTHQETPEEVASVMEGLKSLIAEPAAEHPAEQEDKTDTVATGLPEIPETATVPETAEAEQTAEVPETVIAAETERTEEVADTMEATETEEKEEISDTTETAETEGKEEIADTAESTETEQKEDISDTAETTEAEEKEDAAEEPETEEAVQTAEIPETAAATETEAAVETNETAAAAATRGTASYAPSFDLEETEEIFYEQPYKPGRPVLHIVLILIAVVVLALVTFVVLAHVAPDFIDSILYSPEELELIRSSHNL